MKEIWKDIKEYEGIYQISNFGRIKSLDRKSIRNNIIYHQKESIRKTHVDKYGYLNSVLCKNNKSYNLKVHRLIAQAFIPNPNNLPQVNHINGIKTDNRIENLEWCSNLENMQHAYKNNLLNNTGINNPSAKLDINKVNEIRQLKNKMKGTDVAKLYNVSSCLIYSIWKNRIWKNNFK